MSQKYRGLGRNWIIWTIKSPLLFDEDNDESFVICIHNFVKQQSHF